MRGDCRLATVEAPDATTAVAFLLDSASASASAPSLLLGCVSGAVHQLPLGPLLKPRRASDRHGVLIRLGDEEGGAAHRCWPAPVEGSGAILRFLPLEGSGDRGRVVVITAKGAAVLLLGAGGEQQPAMTAMLPPPPEDQGWAAWACLEAAAAAACMKKESGGRGGDPAAAVVVVMASASSPSVVRWQRCAFHGGSSTPNAIGGELDPPFQGRVVALLSSSHGLLLVEDSGRMARLVEGAWQEVPRPLQLSPGPGGRVVEAVLLREGGEGRADLLAYRVAQGSVWIARLAEEEDELSAPTQLDLAPDALGLTGATASALFVLTRRDRLVCVDAREGPKPAAHQPQHPSRRRPRAPNSSSSSSSGSGSAEPLDFEEEEALVNKIETAARATRVERARLAATEAALEQLRSAWAVVAGRGLLAASLDLEHESTGPPRLWARLQSPGDAEALPLRGWSLLLRLESAVEAPAPRFLLQRGHHEQQEACGDACSVMAGGSWPLNDLGPGDNFQASLPLPTDVVASPLPVIARLALCYPFAAGAPAGGGSQNADGEEAEEEETWPAGICLELGSRPLDLLDLARPPRRVPTTPSELRCVEMCVFDAACLLIPLVTCHRPFHRPT